MQAMARIKPSLYQVPNLIGVLPPVMEHPMERKTEQLMALQVPYFLGGSNQLYRATHMSPMYEQQILRDDKILDSTILFVWVLVCTLSVRWTIFEVSYNYYLNILK